MRKLPQVRIRDQVKRKKKKKKKKKKKEEDLLSSYYQFLFHLVLFEVL